MEDNALRFPIGQFIAPETISQVYLKDWTNRLETLPARLENLVKSFSNEQLDTPYRPGGWTVRQLVHHLADSHHHCYTRFKWSLTEDWPVIKAYDQDDLAMLKDYEASISFSLAYLRHCIRSWFT